MRIGSWEGTPLPRISGHEYQRRQAGKRGAHAVRMTGSPATPARRTGVTWHQVPAVPDAHGFGGRGRARDARFAYRVGGGVQSLNGKGLRRSAIHGVAICRVIRTSIWRLHPTHDIVNDMHRALLLLIGGAAAAFPAGFQAADFVKLRSVGVVQLSPDGARIAYTVIRNDGPGRAFGQLWIMTLADQESICLSTGDEPSGNPEWSPDGKSIARLMASRLRMFPRSLVRKPPTPRAIRW